MRRLAIGAVRLVCGVGLVEELSAEEMGDEGKGLGGTGGVDEWLAWLASVRMRRASCCVFVRWCRVKGLAERRPDRKIGKLIFDVLQK